MYSNHWAYGRSEWWWWSIPLSVAFIYPDHHGGVGRYCGCFLLSSGSWLGISQEVHWLQWLNGHTKLKSEEDQTIYQEKGLWGNPSVSCCKRSIRVLVVKGRKKFQTRARERIGAVKIREVQFRVLFRMNWSCPFSQCLVCLWSFAVCFTLFFATLKWPVKHS